MPGEGTQQFIRGLGELIRETNAQVNKTAIDVAVIKTKQDQTHSEVIKINSRVVSLEDTRSENIGQKKKTASIRKTITWILGIITACAGLVFGAIKLWQ